MLGAPALFSESLPGVPSSLIDDAVLAHMLAVIDSFGTARIEDERIEASPQVFAVLGHVRRERDRAMMRLYSRTPFAERDFRSSDAMTIRALRGSGRCSSRRTPWTSSSTSERWSTSAAPDPRQRRAGTHRGLRSAGMPRRSRHAGVGLQGLADLR